MSALGLLGEQLDRIEADLKQLIPQNNYSIKQRHVISMLNFMALGKKIEAIKECRSALDVNLKDAKDFICNVMDRKP